MNLICFDLEGPLSPLDNAYELMKLFPRGDVIFPTISRYDDLLTLEGREDYEPGDTLALIVPFLAYHGISEEIITDMGKESELTPGAAELIAWLHSRRWRTFCISTSYEQYAMAITGRLGISRDNVACTYFPLDTIRQELKRADFALLERAEEEIVNLASADDNRLMKKLDHFYLEELPQTSAGKIIRTIKPTGGQRKVEALQRFTAETGKPLSAWAVVGDSITDFKMLRAVNRVGGLAIAFNANEYVLSYATMGLASTRLDDLWPALQALETGRLEAVEEAVKEKEEKGGRGNRENFHWLKNSKDISRPLQIHRIIRQLVRKDAAHLG